MRIISQNGLLSINFEDCQLSVCHEAILYRSNYSHGSLGEYKTKERAMEVFNEIHDTWRDEYSLSVYEMP